MIIPQHLQDSAISRQKGRAENYLFFGYTWESCKKH